MKAELEASYVEFVAARRSWLRRVAYALCGDWAAAEDLTQIALEKLYVAWPQVRRRGAEEAYARRIIVRAGIDESRRPWRRERPDSDAVSTDRRGARTAPDPALSVAEREPVIEALQQLPLMQRKVVVLRHLYDLSVEETAGELGISEGTVKSHTARGMTSLEKLLEDRGRAPIG